jgi:hypothetical protein
MFEMWAEVAYVHSNKPSIQCPHADDNVPAVMFSHTCYAVPCIKPARVALTLASLGLTAVEHSQLCAFTYRSRFYDQLDSAVSSRNWPSLFIAYEEFKTSLNAM